MIKYRPVSKRIYARLREMGYGGKYTQVKEAVRELLRVKQEVFMPLVHQVGEAQVGFGYALAKVSVDCRNRVDSLNRNRSHGHITFILL